jgi:hypothetical protein
VHVLQAQNFFCLWRRRRRRTDGLIGGQQGDGDQRIPVDLRIPSSSVKKFLPGQQGDGDQRIPSWSTYPFLKREKNLPVTPAQDPKSSWRARSWRFRD